MMSKNGMIFKYVSVGITVRYSVRHGSYILSSHSYPYHNHRISIEPGGDEKDEEGSQKGTPEPVSQISRWRIEWIERAERITLSSS